MANFGTPLWDIVPDSTPLSAVGSFDLIFTALLISRCSLRCSIRDVLPLSLRPPNIKPQIPALTDQRGMAAYVSLNGLSTR